MKMKLTPCAIWTLFLLRTEKFTKILNIFIKINDMKQCSAEDAHLIALFVRRLLSEKFMRERAIIPDSVLYQML